MTTSSSSSPWWILLTAFLWGATDPLLKQFGKESISREEEQKRQRSKTSRKTPFHLAVFSELRLFLGNPKYAAAFAANQAGSVTFLVALAGSDISAAVPAANGLKFAFNFAAGRALGEERVSPRTAAGLALVVVGSLLQLWAAGV